MDQLFYFLGILFFLNELEWTGLWWIWALISGYFLIRFFVFFVQKAYSFSKKNKLKENFDLAKEERQRQLNALMKKED